MIISINFQLGKAAQRFALPALGRGQRSRPARKMTRRRKLLGICAESPASGARCVRQFSGHSSTLYFSKSFSIKFLDLFASMPKEKNTMRYKKVSIPIGMKTTESNGEFEKIMSFTVAHNALKRGEHQTQQNTMTMGCIVM